MNVKEESRLKVGIIGAGFAGTAFAAALHGLSSRPVEITLFDKTGCFGAGDAYRTPFPFHLLNVRARDMSAIEKDPSHFVNWLSAQKNASEYIDPSLPISDQFVSRFLYGNYLNDLLNTIARDMPQKMTVKFEPCEVIDAIPAGNQVRLILKNQREVSVDKVILALGNNAPTSLPFPVSSDVRCIANPWDYAAPKQIPTQDPVLIVGTGLSMIDTVLTLHAEQHQGKIYAVSRRGLLPLPHAHASVPYLLNQADLPSTLRSLTRHVRAKSQSHIEGGGDWRSIINELRTHLPGIWEKASLPDKKRFIRHVMPYWNVHRHRVHNKLLDLLTEMSAKQQFTLLSGRVLAVENGLASIRLRHQQETSHVAVKWIVNCLGPAMTMMTAPHSLTHALLSRHIASLDALNLGFAISPSGALKETSGNPSSVFYTVGSMRRGACWEATAVPEIRKQCFELAKIICQE